MAPLRSKLKAIGFHYIYIYIYIDDWFVFKVLGPTNEVPHTLLVSRRLENWVYIPFLWLFQPTETQYFETLYRRGILKKTSTSIISVGGRMLKTLKSTNCATWQSFGFVFHSRTYSNSKRNSPLPMALRALSIWISASLFLQMTRL